MIESPMSVTLGRSGGRVEGKRKAESIVGWGLDTTRFVAVLFALLIADVLSTVGVASKGALAMT